MNGGGQTNGVLRAGCRIVEDTVCRQELEERCVETDSEQCTEVAATAVGGISGQQCRIVRDQVCDNVTVGFMLPLGSVPDLPSG